MMIPQSRSPFHNLANSKRAAVAVIALLGVLVYFRSLFFGFTYLDDNVLILDDMRFLQDIKNAPQAFTREVFHVQNASAAYYRPVLTLSFMFDAQLGKSRPLVYHASNIIFHIIASWLVFFLFVELGVSRVPSLCLSCVFTAHPLLSQAVAWIPGRNDSLLAIFLFSSMITFARFMAHGDRRWLICHCAAFTLGLFTKESMILFVFLAALWYWRSITAASTISRTGRHGAIAQLMRGIAAERLKIVKLVVIWAVPSAAWLILRHIALVNPVHYGSAETIKSLFTNAPGIVLDIGKTLFPINLSVLPILRDSTLLYGILAVLLFALFAWNSFFTRSTSREAGKTETRVAAGVFLFGIAWFLSFLLPSLIRPNAAYPADFIEHRMYAPFFGILLSLSQLRIVRKMISITPTVCAVFGFLIAVFTLVTEIRIGVFGDRMAFWEDAVKHSFHHPLAHKNLGAMLHLDGNYYGAEKEYRVALDLHPCETMVHNNLGLIYKHRKEYDKARREFMEELRINPSYADAYYNWGLMCFERGQIDEAKALWTKTLICNPHHYDAQIALSCHTLDPKAFLNSESR